MEEYNITEKRRWEQLKNFKSYTGTNQREQQTATAEELTKKIASAYHGRSNADMMRGILAEAEKGKRAGTLSNEDIENFYQTFSPMLDNSQRKKLRVIIERLNSIE